MMDLKEKAALHALSYVQDGMILGLGSGSTSKRFIQYLGEQWQQHVFKDLRVIATSQASAALADSYHLPPVSLKNINSIDLVVDGADEVDPNLNLIKGLGLALLREKIVEIHARQFVVIVDDSKLVERLGRGALPVEILPFEAESHIRWLQSLGCRAELWLDENNQPIQTDNCNFMARCWFSGGIGNLSKLAWLLNERPGVIEHGLFINMANEVIVASQDGLWCLKKETETGLISKTRIPSAY